ncbi:Arf-GAP with coiled-coil, ANK repeat and PH domain-containing protein 2 [Melipona quadrifasciata]|uniref:Arf-GAP with coiled-coil, ANK repeat and PH domain-containing protein 2 n=1 Tax=Melipona quadrifasciata TaxID=166423 RepID=A0A0M8ZXN5_9HYME|nr:Arf-GAP with coiled-coil, ANK repeat and PH domain-containing protein 2 [Melipona quadrifasciata]
MKTVAIAPALLAILYAVSYVYAAALTTEEFARELEKIIKETDPDNRHIYRTERLEDRPTRNCYDTPCGWNTYDSTTRRATFFMPNTCGCPVDMYEDVHEKTSKTEETCEARENESMNYRQSTTPYDIEREMFDDMEHFDQERYTYPTVSNIAQALGRCGLNGKRSKIGAELKVLKNCDEMIDTGKPFVAQQSQFSNVLGELSLYFADDLEIMTLLNRLIHALQEMNKFRTVSLDQASRTAIKDLNSFIKSDIKRVKEHQGTDLAQDLDPFFKDLGENLITMRCNIISAKLEKEMENRHVYVMNPKMEGYLFKRTSNAFKTWNRKWFCLRYHQLVYRKRTGDNDYTIMEEDLRFCTVKPVVDCDRRNCFEVLSPTKRSHVLQADGEEAYLAWVTVMQEAIGAAIQRGMGIVTIVNIRESQSQNVKGLYRQNISLVWEQILKIAGNVTCCDCGGANPRCKS